MKPFSIIRTLLAALVAGLLTISAQATMLLVVGDSLSDAYNMPRESGWAHLLSERLGDDYSIVNASISGETTAGAAHRIDDLLKSHQPHVLLVILGGNDGLRALNPRQIENNLASIVEKGKRAGAGVALMQIRLPPNLGPVYVERFEAVYPRLADRFDVTLVPFFLEGIFDQPGMMMADGIHPTIQAQTEMLDNLWPHLQALLASRK